MRITYKVPPFDSSFHFALYFVSISYKGTCATFWRVLDGTKYFYFFLERFVYPIVEQLGVIDIPTYKCSYNLI